MSRCIWMAVALLLVLGVLAPVGAGELALECRHFDEGNAPVMTRRVLAGAETAIVVVDMWDAHWCKTHTGRVSALAQKMNPVLDAARQLGVQVVFSPSDVVDYYKDDPRRQAVVKMARHEKPAVEAFDPPLPPWAKTGGCECGPERPCKGRNDAWTRQNAALAIKDGDLIVNGNDNQELYNVCREKGITTLLYMGTAANMCISWTRSVSMRQMRRLGFDCVLVRDMALAISGQGYDPDKKQKLAWFGPLYADDLVFQHLDRYFGASALSVDILMSAGQARPVFTAEQVKAYQPKGPTQCFRHLCYDYNWPGRAMSDLPEKFSQADPVAMAEFSERCNLDAALLLAVPHHGYCTYETRVGTKFPAMKGDWYGRVIEEHHKRGISALGYITLNWNFKYLREHYDKPYVEIEPEATGLVNGYICLNAPGYVDLVEQYTREVLARYPVDGIRYDILLTKVECLCVGCKALYRELYGEELTSWEGVAARRRKEFELEVMRRPVLRLNQVAKSIKPSVEIWQNHINLHSPSDVNMGRVEDIAYIEFGAPGQLLILNGILDKQGIIVGQTLKSPIRRQIMALGARCYQYAHKSEMDQRTALPLADKTGWFYNDLAPFFAMVREVQPYLEGARPFAHVAGVYSENTRYRYEGFERKAYVEVCDGLTLACLQASLPLNWVNVLDLGKKDLRQYRVLVLPETSGLTSEQLDRLRGYVVGGGQLLVVGDALRYDERGRARDDFSLAEDMGLRWKGVESVTLEGKAGQEAAEVEAGWEVEDWWQGGVAEAAKAVKRVQRTSAEHGSKLLELGSEAGWTPLLHVNEVGVGRVAYLASADSPALTLEVLRWLAEGMPVVAEPSEKQVVLTRQAAKGRWVLHLLSDGDYRVRLAGDLVAARRVVEQYPADGWSYKVNKAAEGLEIEVGGGAKDRLLVLE